MFGMLDWRWDKLILIFFILVWVLVLATYNVGPVANHAYQSVTDN
jgi:hypothetical protein